MPTSDQAPQRPRVCLVVPSSDVRRLAGAARAGADEVVLDLGGAHAAEVDVARANVVDALRSHDYGDALVTVRVSALWTPWAYRDIVDVVEQAGDFLDALAVPDVRSPADVEFVDLLVDMVSRRLDIGHVIDLRAQVSLAAGLSSLDELAVAADRLDTLVLDPAALADAVGAAAPAALVGAARLRVLAVGRAAGLSVIEATDPAVDDVASHARDVRAAGLDGLWCTRPAQITAARSSWDTP